jgi:ATPase family associated with various cellular activities (AAA)
MSVFDDLPRTPATHFQLHAYGAVLHLRSLLPTPDDENGLEFLSGYYAQLGAGGFVRPDPGEQTRWWAAVEDWERRIDGHLPLRALKQAYDLDAIALTLLFTAGLADEDARFGALFEALNGVAGEPRPTMGLLATWTEGDAARLAAQRLLGTGLLEGAGVDLPRSRWALHVPPLLWDAMHGGPPQALPAWVRYTPADLLPALDDLLLPVVVARALERAPALLGRRTLIVRGPRSSGRRTAAAAVANAAGLGLLELNDPLAGGTCVGPLATLLHALPLVALDPAPGETVELPGIPGYDGPLAAVAGRRGGIRTSGAVTIRLELPDPLLRAAHWSAALGDEELGAHLGTRLRTTAGTIHRVAELARGEAVLAGRPSPREADIRSALLALESEALETLATRVPATGTWDDLAVTGETARELELLEIRCRNRERLHETVGAALAAQLTPGVRALFSGPSGTGKTLAARLLAAALDKEIYSLNLATVVDKFLGETEKNLDSVMSRAEELDVVLALDEGDALMTRRTDVHTSNDRYANLETNFLLQRLESYEGILIVTSNAGERIDSAFRRRLDVVVEFRAPDAQERWAIWQLHLPPDHVVSDSFLDEVAGRCQLTGGQIRNAVLHASLLALDEDALLDGRHVELGVRREYRKAGSVCPLRPVAVAHG